MKPTQQLHDAGQSIWLDNITRDLLDSGTLRRYVDELSVTGPRAGARVASLCIMPEGRNRREHRPSGPVSGWAKLAACCTYPSRREATGHASGTATRRGSHRCRE